MTATSTDVAVAEAKAPSLDPGSPEGISWFESTMQQAQVLAQSEIIPKAFRGKAADIVVAAMYGRDFGWSPTASMNNLVVIDGKPTLTAQSMVALVRARGHSISGELSSTQATVVGRRSDTGDEMSFSFSVWDAERAGLCSVNDEGVTRARSGNGRKLPWETYPEAMCWARAVSQLCRVLFPDLLSAVSYVPEEAESFSPQSGGGAGGPGTPSARKPPGEIKVRIGELRSRVEQLDEDGKKRWETWRDQNGFDPTKSTVELLLTPAEDLVRDLLKDQGADPFLNPDDEVVDAEIVESSDGPEDPPPPEPSQETEEPPIPPEGGSSVEPAALGTNPTINEVKAWARARGLELPAASGWRRPDWQNWAFEKERELAEVPT